MSDESAGKSEDAFRSTRHDCILIDVVLHCQLYNSLAPFSHISCLDAPVAVPATMALAVYTVFWGNRRGFLVE
jgi:hypothetical protein